MPKKKPITGDQEIASSKDYSSETEKTEMSKDRKFLLIGVWVYFFLLIFEGALRKWFLPALSAPLLIVRDPVAIVLMVYAWQRNLFPTVSYNVWMFAIGTVSVFTTLFIAHGNISVTIYGARILFIHFPVIFLFGAILNREDVVKIGKVVVWMALPMAVLVALQFYSPQSAWVNRGVGGDMGGAGFSGAMGYYRPPGTFSFTNGVVLFFSMAASYIFYFWLRPSNLNRLVLLAATGGLIIAIPLSISRSLLFSVLVIAMFVFFILAQNPKMIGRVVVAGIGLVVLFILLGNLDFFQTSTEVFTSRFDRAAEAEGGVEGTLIDRYLGGMLSAITESFEQPFFGKGLGLGTNAGSALLSGSRTFLVSEGEWGRVVGEMGALLGLMVIGIRLLVSLKVSLAGYARLKQGDILPWILLGFALIVFPQGQWAQPTTLGFSTMIMSLLIGSFNRPEIKNSITNKEENDNAELINGSNV